MKDFRFFLEYASNADKRKGTVKNPGPHTGNVVAIDTQTGHVGHGNQYTYEGFSSVYDHPDSAVNWGGATVRYLREKCRRIPEALARQIHPALFQRLDNN